jgi:hypothetical protein
MIDHEIRITVDTDDHRIDFSYAPTTVHVRHGDRVHWVCPEGPFAVEFLKDTPSDRMGAHGERHETVWRSASIPIRRSARGHFPYGGAVSLQNGRFGELVGRVALDTGCPEIIVD